jgi:hypothetical protein
MFATFSSGSIARAMLPPPRRIAAASVLPANTIAIPLRRGRVTSVPLIGQNVTGQNVAGQNQTGPISMANSDAGASAHTSAAVDHAYRAVQQHRKR